VTAGWLADHVSPRTGKMSSLKNVRFLFLLVVMLQLGSCMRSVSEQRPTEGIDTQTEQTLLLYIQVGEQRTLTASGPEFRLPDSYYELAKEHPEVTMHILKERLKSKVGNIRANAYDFVLTLAEVPQTREQSLNILKAALTTEGFAIQQFVRPGYERLIRQSPETQHQ